MIRIELEYSRNYSEEVNAFLLNAPEIEQYLVELHGFLRTKFAGVATLDLAFMYQSADFLGDKAGEFLSVTIEHDLTEVKGQQVFMAITSDLQRFGGLLSFDVRSRIPAQKKIEPVDHTPNPCSWDGDAPCEEWGGLAFHGKRYCDKHALGPAMEELIALRRQAVTAKQAWAAGAEWAIEMMEDLDNNSESHTGLSGFIHALRRDMKLENPNRTSPS